MTVSKRLAPFGLTIFTEMTTLANQHGAINLGQGFPDWDGPDFVKAAAAASLLDGGEDQYPPMGGVPALREAVAARFGPLLSRTLDPAAEITITSGCTEGLAASFLGLVDPGDEVIVIEPFYDAYPVGVALAGGVARYLPLEPPEYRLDPDRLESLVSNRTKAVVVNTPQNPTGRVFDRSELAGIARLCVERGLIAISDEVYEEMVYGTQHLRLATFDGMWERTITLSSVGKTYSVTGWKVGWAIAAKPLTAAVRSAHQFLTFTTSTPVQHGSVAALYAPHEFYVELRTGYESRRDLLAAGLDSAGFEVHMPQGTYFMMAGYRHLSDVDDRTFARQLIERVGVATVPPSAFRSASPQGDGTLRFAFCKSRAVLEAAVARLQLL